MAKSKKQRKEGKVNQPPINDILKSAAAFFRDEADNYNPYSPLAEKRLINAGATILMPLEKGAFPKIGERLLTTFDKLHTESAETAYEWLWQNFVKKLRRQYELYPSDPCIESFAVDCRFVADELEKEDQALAITKQTGVKAKSQTEKLSAKAKTIAVWTEHPDWTDIKIANEAGISRTTLYDYPEFKNLRAMQKQSKNKIRCGSKSQDGTIEAIDK